MQTNSLAALLLLLLISIWINQNVIDARSPPYFGPNDRGIRTPAQTQLRVDTTLDIFLMEILPFKARFVLKNVSKNCSRALTPLIDNCYKDYELESKYTLRVRGTAEELKVGCCNLWKYHECVVEAVEKLAHYSFKSCNENDAEAAEQVLEATEAQPKAKLMCANYSSQSFYCSNFIEGSLALTLVIILGLSAVLVAALLAGFMFYLSTLKTRIIYIPAPSKSNGYYYYNDGVELMEKGKKPIINC